MEVMYEKHKKFKDPISKIYTEKKKMIYAYQEQLEKMESDPEAFDREYYIEQAKEAIARLEKEIGTL